MKNQQPSNQGNTTNYDQVHNIPPGTKNEPQGTQPPGNQNITAGGAVTPIPPPGQAIPTGLDSLLTVDQIFVRQKVELLEDITGFETANQYEIFNNMNQVIFTAREDSNFIARNCCDNLRPLTMRVKDITGNEVIHFERPLNCDNCCCPCCLQKIEAFAPPGVLVGALQQEWTFYKPRFVVQNAARQNIFFIKGPICRYTLCKRPVKFQVLSLDETMEVGVITKEWSGILREGLTDADFFGVSFPLDLDLRMKVAMLGACFLIDLMFFESSSC